MRIPFFVVLKGQHVPGAVFALDDRRALHQCAGHLKDRFNQQVSGLIAVAAVLP